MVLYICSTLSVSLFYFRFRIASFCASRFNILLSFWYTFGILVTLEISVVWSILFFKIILAFMFFLSRFPFEHFAFDLAPLTFWWLWKFLCYEAIFFKKIILVFMFFLQRFPFEHFIFVLVALTFWWVWKFLWYEAFYFKVSGLRV